MRHLKLLISVLRGNAVVITQKEADKADVTIGKNVNKQFALSSLAGAVRALML